MFASAFQSAIARIPHSLFSLLKIVFLLLCVLNSCKEQSAPADNLFKFKEYIVYTSQGRQSVKSPIRIEVAKALTQFELDQEIPSDIIKMTPNIKGVLTVRNQRLLEFVPAVPLEGDTEYEVTFFLDKLYDDLEEGMERFQFSFKTITPDFKVDLQALQSYSKQFNYIEGQIEGSDDIAFAKAKKLLSATQNNRLVSIKWLNENESSRFHPFRIDSIARYEENSVVQITWDGKEIGASGTQGTNTITIPGRNHFTIVGVDRVPGANASLSINFSDPLKEKQNFTGLVTLQNAGNLRYEVNGNVLQVYPENRIVGAALLEVFQGVQSQDGYKLKQQFSEAISFEQLKPALRAVSNGVILPNASGTPYYFEAVNLSHVDVRIIKIYENNVLEYLQDGQLHDQSSYNLRRVGRRIAKKTIPLSSHGDINTGQWKAHGVDVSSLFKADPGAVYRVEVSFKQAYAMYECAENIVDTEQDNSDGYDDEYSYYDASYTETHATDEEEREEQYWDNRIYQWRSQIYNWEQEDNPCHPAFYTEDRFVNSNLLGSDLGVIVKKGKDNSYVFAATDIITPTPEANTKITLYNYQKQVVATVTTDATGMARITPKNNISYAVAIKDKNYAYLKLEDGNSLSMSKFDIAGNQLEKGLKGFTYTERGVHRPGDSIHLTFVLDDKANPLPKGHPVKLEVTDARGKLSYKKVLVSKATLSSDQSKELSSGQAVNNFYHFPIPTQVTDPTGNWNALISVGGVTFNKVLKVETIKPNRLKVHLDFDSKILNANGNIKGNANVKWLHGAPARNLKIKSDATIRTSYQEFEQFPTYTFYDPIRRFDEIEINVVDGTLNEQGVLPINKKLALSKRAPGMLKATFVTKAY